ncbi:MAG: hypothetical protein II755_01240 [Prevotella sp.]|nr:hypothetical protein [Prevotella sp.]
MEKLLQRIGLLCAMLLATMAGSAATTASWDFQNDLPAGICEATNYQGVEADVESDVPGIMMHVDATAGKLYCVGRNNAQMNPGTVLRIPVSTTDDVVTVTGYPGYCHFAVGGDENGDENVVSHTATNAEKSQGYVEVTATAGSNYIYKISVELQKPDVNAKWDFRNDLPAGICEATNYQGVEADVESTVPGVKMHVDATNGKLYCVGRNNAQMNPGTIIRVPVVSNADVVTVEGYPGYCHFAVGGDANGEETIVSHTATNAEQKQGYVEVTVTDGNNYIYCISVVQKPSLAPVKVDNADVTATFPFNLGTEEQKAEFGDAADYFLNSKVVLGSELIYKGTKSDPGFTETAIEPLSQINEPTAGNIIQFVIQPKYGLTFTPTEVSLKTTRYGTDNGLLDIAWLNGDGTTIPLASEVKPIRNNTDPKFDLLTYAISDAPAMEGVCGLQVNLYHLQSGKQIGFADIVIKGVVNGEQVDVPMLGGFTANGVDYVADKIFEASGDQYVATIELSKAEEMVSESNPVSNINVVSGELGEVTYEGDATQCAVTIPVTLAGITINYIANFVQKPDFTLTYYDTDRTVMGTQLVEKDSPIGSFAIDYSTAKAEEGYKVRGWFVKTAGGKKYSTSDIVTSDLSLYAVATEIEVVSSYKKYEFNLADPNFDANDHEAFESTGSGRYYNEHGWVFGNGDRITLLTGEKASIFVGNCLYSNANAQLVFKNDDGEELGRIAGKGESDGEIYTFNYEGQGGKLHIDIESNGAVYIHNIRIVNTEMTNYVKVGNWYIVLPGDVTSFNYVLDAVNGANGSRSAERSYIFLPNGTYDLGETALTTISGHNISIIGQSMEGTIITNAPDVSTEGIGTTATLLNTGQNLYMQDLTLKNGLDYYSAGSAGRAVCLQDKGDRAIFKNVAMLSYQDTYYSQNTKQSYWENCDIHGTVDFLCGGGDVRFQNTTLSLEPRSANGTGGRTICAPTTQGEFGYVFDNCKVVDLARGKGDWNFGRTWQNAPIAVYLNTTLDANAEATLVGSRWTQKGMNNRDPRLFGEYGTKNEMGEDITPASNIITSFGGTFETIIDAEKAAEFTYEKMFKENANAWDPAAQTEQKAAPAATYANGEVTWEPVDGAIAYAIFVNDQFIHIVTDGTSFAHNANEGDIITIRSANAMGGLGEAVTIEVKATEAAISDSDTETLAPGEYPVINSDRVLLAGLNTVVLPFETTAEELGAQKVLKYDGTQARDGKLYLTFSSVSEMAANTPYVVFVDEDKAIAPFEDKTVESPTDLTVSDPEYSFVGTYTCFAKGASPIVSGDLIGGTEDFVLANGGNALKAYRAYMKKVGTSKAAIGFLFDNDVVDGIETLEQLEQTGMQPVFNLNGQRVSRPQKGVFISGGKKVIVK